MQDWSNHVGQNFTSFFGSRPPFQYFFCSAVPSGKLSLLSQFPSVAVHGIFES